MTIEEIKEMGDELMREAIETLTKEGSIAAYFVLRTADEHVEVWITDASINDRDFKTKLSLEVRQRIAKGDILVVAFVSDIFFAQNITPQANRVRIAFGLDIEQAHAAGLCEKREGIAVQIESPIYRRCATQEYRRQPGGAIEIVGQPRIAEGDHVLPSKMGRWMDIQPGRA